MVDCASLAGYVDSLAAADGTRTKLMGHPTKDRWIAYTRAELICQSLKFDNTEYVAGDFKIAF